MDDRPNYPPIEAAADQDFPDGLTTGRDLVDLSYGVKYVETSGVQGDIAEFGCFKGRSAALLAWSMKYLTARKLWVFDSFKGMPKATSPVDLRSPDVCSGAWKWDADITPESVRAACASHMDPERIKVVPGWFKDTMPSIPDDTLFALAHLDCDLYLSTVQVLDRLFRHRHLADGATLFFDDWYCNRANPHLGQQKAWTDLWNNAPDGYAYTNMGAYGLVGHRFIVHRWK